MRPSDTIKIGWDYTPPDDIDEKVRNLVEEAGWPDDKKLCHKKEQLYLALQQGMSMEMIHEILLDTQMISSRDIDYLRSTAMLAGEDFVRRHFYSHAFTVGEAEEMLREYFSGVSGHLQKEIVDLINEKEAARQKFEFNMSFISSLQQMTEDLKQSQKELIESTRWNAEQLVKSKEEQIIQLENQLEEQRKATADWKRRYEEIRTNKEDNPEPDSCIDDGRCGFQPEGDPAEKSVRSNRISIWQRIRNNRSASDHKQSASQNIDRERTEFVTRILGQAKYTEEQLDLVLQAVKEGFSMEELQQLCQENIRPENMGRLFVFIKSRKEIDGQK